MHGAYMVHGAWRLDVLGVLAGTVLPAAAQPSQLRYSNAVQQQQQHDCWLT
jgi:hypothetical protein